MKVLLDNCVDWRIGRIFSDHEVTHAKDVGWANLSNGRLLAEASKSGFDVIITVDKKIKYEQNLDRLPLSVMEINLLDSRLPSIIAITSQLLEGLDLVSQFRFISIDQDGRITTAGERK